jgi:polyvinyl alcohol dehydrogenase (cytochrome)
MRRALALAAAGLAVFTLMAPAAHGAASAGCSTKKSTGGDWPMYGHDYGNSRFQDMESKIGTVQAAALQKAWAFSTNGKGDFTGTPVESGGCVFVGSNNGWAFAINADTGKLVWQTLIDKNGGINSSAAVDGGRVFYTVSHVSKPSLIALDEATGKLLWQTIQTTQKGSDVYSSPVVFEDMVIAGWSGGSAELGNDKDRRALQGGFVILDAKSGGLLKRTYTIHPPNPKQKDNFAGGGIWATFAVDPAQKIGFVGTGNPFRAQAQYKFTDSIIKVDLNRAHATFGEIIDHFQGIPETYNSTFEQLPCYDIPGNPPPYYPQGLGKCMQLDLDFGASPNLYWHDGTERVGEGQKSGVYWVINAKTMKPIHETVLGPPSSVGGIVGSTATDGGAIYGPVTEGYVWSESIHDGTQAWVSPVADGAHWGEPVVVAKGVVYSVDLRGALDAFDASSGAPILVHPMEPDTGGLTASWGGVSVARNTVYAAVGITGLSTGYVVAYRPAPGV